MEDFNYEERKRQLSKEKKPSVAAPNNIPLWQRFNQVFKQVLDHPDLPQIAVTAAEVTNLLSDHFGNHGDYSFGDVERMLQLGFPKINEDQYLIKREDFYKPISN